MRDSETLTLETEQLATAALCAAGASRGNAMAVAAGIAAAERDGVASHGLSYLATYCEPPALPGRRSPLIVVDAHAGFAHPAITRGLTTIIPLPVGKELPRLRCAIPALAASSPIVGNNQRPPAYWDCDLRMRRLRSPWPAAGSGHQSDRHSDSRWQRPAVRSLSMKGRAP
jgi:hypothetical protein